MALEISRARERPEANRATADSCARGARAESPAARRRDRESTERDSRLIPPALVLPTPPASAHELIAAAPQAALPESGEGCTCYRGTNSKLERPIWSLPCVR